MTYSIDETKNWLENRFKAVDENGIYVGHQPIYGFKNGPAEPGAIDRYIITFQILRHLEGIEFSSLLDIGGAEGYKSALIKKVFSVEVHSSDLSEEACKRARELYGISATSAKITELPFDDNSFDIVICSETLEHVQDFQEAVIELLRVAKSAVIITVPMETPAFVADTIARGEMHGHIQSLTAKSFDFLDDTLRVSTSYHHCRWLKPLRMLLSHEERKGKKFPPFVYKIFNTLSRFVNRNAGRLFYKNLIKLDLALSTNKNSYGLLVVIEKQKNKKYLEKRRLNLEAVLDFKRDHYRLQN